MGGEVWVPNGCTILQMRPYLLDIIIVWRLLEGLCVGKIFDK